VTTVPNFESWNVSKPAVTSDRGLVASQHHIASRVGAQVLANGGNAIDAAVATGLAIGGVEPWMSGIGGGGFMLVYLAEEKRSYAVDFGMIAPRDLDPADYPLSQNDTGDLFGWPGVQEDRNIHGYHSIAVPGHIAGMALALERFGTKSWAESLGPAIELAESGMPVDWYAGLLVGGGAPILRQYDESRRVYLPGDLPPMPDWQGNPANVKLGQLAETLRRLASAGPRDFYEGEIAQKLVRDAQAGGSKLSAADLESYAAKVIDTETAGYRDATVHIAPGLTAGPTLLQVLRQWQDGLTPGGSPGADTYEAYADALLAAYADRLANMGDSDETKAPSCTTHLCTIDAKGNMVALTQTLLSLFGSRVMFPETGILMNNGIMWFDPRPGRPNSIGAGKRPLSNMCPVVVERGDGFTFALGASGGRRIMPAVAQTLSYLVDFGMDLETAFHQPRIDVSGTDTVTVNRRLPNDVTDRLGSKFQTRLVEHGVYPPLFACPNAVGRFDGAAKQLGAAYLMSPWAMAAAPE